MRGLIAAGLFLVPTMAIGQDISTGAGDWSAFPAVQDRGELRMSDRLMDEIEAIAAQGSCQVDGLGREQIDINVPFVIRYKEDGSVDHIVVRHLNCPALESMLGATVLQMARTGQYRPTQQSPSGWHRGQIGFANH